MNANDTPTPQKHDCPYFPELLENRKLRHELERERNRREEAEKQCLPFTIINGLLSLLLFAAFVALVTYGGQNCEDMTTFTYLVYGYMFLFFTFSLALMTVNTTLDRHAKRKKEKYTTDKKED